MYLYYNNINFKGNGMSVGCFDALNPWNHLLTSQSNSKTSNLTKNSLASRVQAALGGTLYDLSMIPVHMIQACAKVFVAPIRAIIIAVDPKRDEKFLKNWNGKAIAKHLYRSLVLTLAVISGVSSEFGL